MRKQIIYTLILALCLCSISCVSTVRRTEACSASVLSDPQATGKTSYRKKYVKMKVTSVSKKKIQIKLSNKGEKNYLYSKLFTVQRWEQGKWKNVKFKDNVLFPKCLFALKKKRDKVVTMKWKNYFDPGLQEGKYRIKWIGNMNFRISSE